MTNRLEGKGILVIGAASGIGAATVKRLANEGARVCAADIDIDGARRVAAAVGGGAFAVPIDISDETSVDAAFTMVSSSMPKLDGVHVNAADLRTIFQDTNALDVDLAVFDRTIAVNLRGHLICTRAAIPRLLASGGGAIVYTSSGACDMGEPERPAYAASKSGINALMRHVASRWGKDGITANCIAPGFVMTPEMIAGGQVPQEWIDYSLSQMRSPRVGSADDIAAVAAMLLSADGTWINGQVLHINGGALFR